MSKKEIQQQIEKLRSQMQELEKMLARSSNFADEQVRIDIAAPAIAYRNTLIQKGGLKDIGESFGEVVEVGVLKHRGIFLTDNFQERDWEWLVDVDMDTNTEVLVRVDKVTGELID